MSRVLSCTRREHRDAVAHTRDDTESFGFRSRSLCLSLLLSLSLFSLSLSLSLSALLNTSLSLSALLNTNKGWENSELSQSPLSHSHSSGSEL
jgi:hypothetical protein